jgi:hypothetical protein
MKFSCTSFALPLFALWVGGGCGVVGPPIPPENVGVAPIIEKQQKLQAQQAGQQPGVIDGAPSEEPQLFEPRGQDEELPPLRPIGTR